MALDRMSSVHASRYYDIHGEKDEGSYRFGLEGLSDRCVDRGIRAAWGFQLGGDAEAAKRGQEERVKEATSSLKL